jgi:hypothetical protein
MDNEELDDFIKQIRDEIEHLDKASEDLAQLPFGKDDSEIVTRVSRIIKHFEDAIRTFKTDHNIE